MSYPNFFETKFDEKRKIIKSGSRGATGKIKIYTEYIVSMLKHIMLRQ